MELLSRIGKRIIELGGPGSGPRRVAIGETARNATQHKIAASDHLKVAQETTGEVSKAHIDAATAHTMASQSTATEATMKRPGSSRWAARVASEKANALSDPYKSS